MFENYFKVAWRNISRNRFYSAINIAGLALGIASFIIIGLWVQDELSYDRHFTNSGRIYRIANDLITEGVPNAMAASEPDIADKIHERYPEVEQVTRILNVPTLLSYGDNAFLEPNTFYVDSTFLDIFSYEFIEGDPRTALDTREAAVITESVAKKMFGKVPAMGKTFYAVNDKTKNGKEPRLVTGIIKDNRRKSHFTADVILVRFHKMDMFEYTYALFRKDYTPKMFMDHVWSQLDTFYQREDAADNQSLGMNLQPITTIHLQSHLFGEIEPNGNINTVYIFSMIAILVLAIAAINYMNLATAKSYDRAKEVGVRKVLGATKKQVVCQFLTESIILSLLALVLALAMVEVVLPFFNRLAGKNMSFSVLEPQTVLPVVVLTILFGVISGIYPAFYISSFAPIKALKGRMDMGRGRFSLRKFLVVFQFTISIVMLIATVVVKKQLAFAKSQDLGFTRDPVLVVNLNDPALRDRTEVIKAELLRNPHVAQASASHNVPGSEMYRFEHKFENEKGDMEAKLITTMLVDQDYQDLMGLHFTAGSHFDKGMLYQLDTSIFIIANESAVRMLGWTDPVGKNVLAGSGGKWLRKGKCIGVVKDFHTASLHETIPPMVFRLARKGFLFLSVKLHTTDIPGAVSAIGQTMRSLSPEYPFEYSFLDDTFNRQYEKDQKQDTIFMWFAGLCIFISCLGLMGLTSFSTRQRTKEIGIRKISGATTTDIIVLIAMDFVRLVLIAFLVAVPVAYYAMSRWLENFAYHTDIGWQVFLSAGAASLAIAIGTISIHTTRAANKNLAEVLKYE